MSVSPLINNVDGLQSVAIFMARDLTGYCVSNNVDAL